MHGWPCRADLEILDKPPEKGDKVLCSPNVARNGFFEQVVRESWEETLVKPSGIPTGHVAGLTRVGHERVFLSAIISAPEPFNELLVLVLKLLLVRVPHLADFVLQALGAPGGSPQRILGDVRAEGLDAHVVNVVGFVKDDNAVFGQVLGDALGNLWVQEVMVGVNDDVAQLHL